MEEEEEEDDGEIFRSDFFFFLTIMVINISATDTASRFCFSKQTTCRFTVFISLIKQPFLFFPNKLLTVLRSTVLNSVPCLFFPDKLPTVVFISRIKQRDVFGFSK